MHSSLLAISALLFHLVFGLADFIETEFGFNVQRDSQSIRPKAGFFTPYGLTPGGGERYFLTSALALLKMGYGIEIIVRADNACQTSSCIDDTLSSLRIPMKSEDFKIRIIPEDGIATGITYDVFYVIGNSKYPTHPAMGEFNIYMCQFPFDFYEKKIDVPGMYEMWSSFNQIIVNSRFTHDWYVKAVQRAAAFIAKSGRIIPTLTVVYPPVQPFEVPTKSESRSKSKRQSHQKFNIALTGRFFKGRQSKGHDAALEILTNITRQTTMPIHLNLIGFVHPDQASFDYVEELRQVASKGKLSVSFLVNAEAHEISAALSKSTIYWHLTGVKLLKYPTQDPASFEHFGISIVEAMYMGCIPIVTSLGGVTDIVSHNVNGMLATSEQDFVAHSLKIIKMSPEAVAKMRATSLRSASRFSVASFMNSLQAVTARGVRGEILHRFSIAKAEEINKMRVTVTRSKTKLTAVLIEPGLTSNLNLIVRNVMHYLDIGWRLHIYFSAENGNDKYMRSVLKELRADYFFLPSPAIVAADYNRLLKSATFWRRYDAAEKVLIFNTDTLLMRTGVQEFWKFDFISAPLLGDISSNRGDISSYAFTETVLDKAAMKAAGIGLGAGISIRTAGAMLKAIESFGNASTDDEPEGIFFAKNLPKLGYSVADGKTSYRFAWEVELPELGRPKKPPLAIHAVWLFMRSDIVQGLIARNAVPCEHSATTFPDNIGDLVKLLLDSPAVEVAHAQPVPLEMQENETEEEEGGGGGEGEQEEARGGGDKQEDGEGDETSSEGKDATKAENKDEEDEKEEGVEAKKVTGKVTIDNNKHLAAVLDGKNTASQAFWKFIHNPSVLLGGDKSKMVRLLDELGVVGMQDLKECEDGHIQQISELVKPVQRNKLRGILLRGAAAAAGGDQDAAR